jgi:hypothetical protein
MVMAASSNAVGMCAVNERVIMARAFLVGAPTMRWITSSRLI